MERVKGLLFEVAKSNMDTRLQGFFIDPDKGMALAGHRRIYGHGDCLVRAMGDFDMPQKYGYRPGYYDYSKDDFYADQPGLYGKQVEGDRYMVGPEESDMIFGQAFEKIEDGFSVLVNPKIICEFIENFTKFNGFANKKLNMQVFNGMSNVGHFTGRIETNPNTGEIGIVIANKYFCHIDKKYSLLNPDHIREGAYVVAEMVGVVEEKRVVRLLRMFKSGIRLAIQDFRNGLMLDNAAPYSLHEETDNGITKQGIMDVPFLERQFDPNDPQSQNAYLKAPVLHFDLDTFYRALKPMEMHRVAEIHFKDCISPVMMRTINEGEPGEIAVESLIGTSSPYRRGKVWTP